VGIAAILWVVVLFVTLLNKGKELVWLIWIVTSLCISGYQMIYIAAYVFIERNMRKRFSHDRI